MQLRVVEAQRLVTIAPQQLLAQGAISTELKKHTLAINQLKQQVPPRSAVGDIVARIENEASKNNVKAIVSDVKVEITYGKDNKPIAQTGPYQDVRLTVQSYGDPAALLSLLHVIEHLPYVLKVPDWSIATDYTVLPAALTVPVPLPGVPIENKPAALLEASVVLTISKDQ